MTQAREYKESAFKPNHAPQDTARATEAGSARATEAGSARATDVKKVAAPSPQTTPDPLPYLEHYLQLGFAITPLLPGTKRPFAPDWNHQNRSGKELREFFTRFPQHGMGLMHAQSGTLVLDIDREGETRVALESVGLDLDSLLDGPCIVSAKGVKPLFRLSETLARSVLAGKKGMHPFSWPNPQGPGRYSIFELRAGYAQDVLPPSRHPSGVRYRWQGQAPRRRNDIPLLEGPPLRLYLEFAELRAAMEAACPWTPAPQSSSTPSVTTPRDTSHIPKSNRFAGTISARAVIAAFNTRTRLHDLLLEYHYAPRGRGRYLMPGSTTGVAGVEVYPAQGDKPERLFSKHAACPLFDSTYKDAFETFKILKHGGLLGPALDEARALVGLG